MCIESLYLDRDLKRTDRQGRRLYWASEFDASNGKHLTEPVYSRSKKSSLVVDSDVFSHDGETRALSKVGFVEVIRDAQADVSFQGFVSLFRQLEAIALHG